MARTYPVSRPLKDDPWHTYRPDGQVTVTSTGRKHNGKVIYKDADGNWYKLQKARFGHPMYLLDANHLK